LSSRWRTASAARPTGGQRLWAVRARARAPRIAVLVACGVLSAGGIKSIVAPQPPARAGRPLAPTSDLAAQAFAQEFARAYLEWDAAAPEAHERAVAPFLGSDVEAGAGLVVPETGAQTVRWATVAGDRRMAGRLRRVTIAAQTTRGRVHLSIAVGRDERGMLFVSAPPAIVGPPPRATNGSSGPEPEVEDRELRAVAARVVRNYLAGEREDLAADLHPRAVVSLPDVLLRVQSTDAVTWASEPRRLAVAVTAAERNGPRFALRYELGVLRVGRRWLVREVHINPIAREGGP
jgi:hypothetical protein